MEDNEEASNSKYKKAALDYLNYLNKHKNFIDTYHNSTHNSIKELYKEASAISHTIEKEYIDLLTIITDKQRKQEYISDEDLAILKMREKKNKAHKSMVNNLEKLTKENVEQDDGILKEFKDQIISDVFLMEENGKSNEEIEQFLLIKLADFYHKKANQE